LSAFTENPLTSCAAGVESLGVTDTKKRPVDVDAFLTSVNKSRRTCQTSKEPNPYCHGSVAKSTFSVSVEQQMPRDSSSILSTIFRTSDLELTDADLEFNPK